MSIRYEICVIRRFRVLGACSVKMPESLNASSLNLGDVLGFNGTNWKEEEEEEEASLGSPKQIMYSTNTLEHTLIFLKYVVNEHVLSSHEFSVTH